MYYSLPLIASVAFSNVSAFHGITLAKHTGRYMTLDQYKAKRQEYADMKPDDTFIADVSERKVTQAVQDKMKSDNQY